MSPTKPITPSAKAPPIDILMLAMAPERDSTEDPSLLVDPPDPEPVELVLVLVPARYGAIVLVGAETPLRVAASLKTSPVEEV